MKQVLWILLAFVLLCACEEKHFMTDPGYRKMVEQDFQKKKKVLEGNPGNLFAVFAFPDERGGTRGAGVSLRLFSVD